MTIKPEYFMVAVNEIRFLFVSKHKVLNYTLLHHRFILAISPCLVYIFLVFLKKILFAFYFSFCLCVYLGFAQNNFLIIVYTLFVVFFSASLFFELSMLFLCRAFYSKSHSYIKLSIFLNKFYFRLEQYFFIFPTAFQGK